MTTPIALGTGPLGGLFTEVSEQDAQETLDAAYDLGVRHFDTAPQYGYGLAETRTGRAIASLERDSVVISTKVGRVLVDESEAEAGRVEGVFVGAPPLRPRFDYSRDGILRSFESSLERLGTDHVDIALVHDPDDHFAEALDAAYPTLAELRSQGVVKQIGFGMNQAEILCEFVRRTDLDTVLVAGRYSLLDQSAARELFPLCQEHGVHVMNAGVFNSGILAALSENATFFYEPAPASVVDQVRDVDAIARRHGTTLLAAAIQFSSAHPAVGEVVLGARTAAEIAADVAASGSVIRQEFWDELIAHGVIPNDSVIPRPEREHDFRR